MMDQRSMAVLNQLLKQDAYITVQELAALLNVSRRTIYSDLDKVNDWLHEYQLGEIKQVRRQGLYLETAVKKAIITKYPFSGMTYYAYSPTERRAWIYIHIVGQSEPYFLEDVRKLFQVSRNTVLEDIKKLKKEMKTYQLIFYSDRKTGYAIEGNENDIRRLLIHFLAIVTPKEGWHSFLSLEETANKEDNQMMGPYCIFDIPLIRLLSQSLHAYEQRFMVEFTDEFLNNIIIWFHFFLRRIEQQSFVEVDAVEREVIKTMDEYKGIQSLCNHVADTFDMTIPENEIYYFAKYLLSAKVNYNFRTHLESKEMTTLLHVVEKMAADFQRYAAIEFREPEQMIQNLLLHLKPAFYRIKYGIELENDLRDLVKKNYSEVFHLTKKVVHHFENIIGQPMNENEVALITMHFGGWLRKEGVMLEPTRKSMLLVCTNGLGTSRLLESQLEGLFSDVETIGVTSLREYEKMDLHVDFIVSTIPLMDRDVPVFVVNPVLDNEDKEQLLKKVNSLFEHSSKNQVYSVETVMDIVRRYAVIQDKESLSKELRSYFHAPINVENEVKKPGLAKLLPSDRIVLKKRVDHWEEAISVAAESLLKQGYIQESYVVEMIENVKRVGPYIVISDHFALPHANPEDGVIKTGMSMLHLEEATDILGKSVNVLVVLASRDNEQHLKALSQLTRLFSNKEMKESMLKTKDKHQLIKMIQSYSTEMKLRKGTGE
ncbi:BglG family transcription antiterminator [Virgibacillus salexigens]|uniref:BglG family transcription antiterminator n=1 Tax=Virgibacillus TaxID=84406 RepID=UPI00157E46F8|nr:BglG family transcription antiterminator [Virgibacillus salexigens]MYL40662.1 PRD domain-containing protein [Virgibacillus massiliensis]